LFDTILGLKPKQLEGLINLLSFNLFTDKSKDLLVVDNE
jgi:hypothetical protein